LIARRDGESLKKTKNFSLQPHATAGEITKTSNIKMNISAESFFPGRDIRFILLLFWKNPLTEGEVLFIDADSFQK